MLGHIGDLDREPTSLYNSSLAIRQFVSDVKLLKRWTEYMDGIEILKSFWPADWVVTQKKFDAHNKQIFLAPEYSCVSTYCFYFKAKISFHGLELFR